MAVGIDVVLVDRFARALARTPLLGDRLFTEAERQTGSGNPRSAESLAARFAAKEAVAKALGAPGWPALARLRGGRRPGRRPWLTVSGTVAAPRPSAASTAGTCRCRTTVASPRPWWWRSDWHEGRAVAGRTDVRVRRSGPCSATVPPGHPHAPGRRRAGPPLRPAAGGPGRRVRRPGAAAGRQRRQRRRRAVRRCPAGRPGRGGHGAAAATRDGRTPACLAALRAAGGRVRTGEPPARADLVLDGIVGIGGRGGLRPNAARRVAGLADLRRRGPVPGHRGGRRRPQRGRGGHRGRAASADGAAVVAPTSR